METDVGNTPEWVRRMSGIAAVTWIGSLLPFSDRLMPASLVQHCLHSVSTLQCCADKCWVNGSKTADSYPRECGFPLD